MKRGRCTLNGEVVFHTVEYAERLFDRIKGLLGRSNLPAGQALWIRPCGSVHTFGMHFPIDLVFLDRAGQVVRVCRDVGPGRMVTGGRGAHSVLEAQAGGVPASLGPGASLRLGLVGDTGLEPVTSCV